MSGAGGRSGRGPGEGGLEGPGAWSGLWGGRARGPELGRGRPVQVLAVVGEDVGREQGDRAGGGEAGA